jgi:hypothetical protein
MNMQATPGVGGFFPGMKPIWHPPVHISWIVSIVLLVIAANAEEIPHKVRSILLNPFVFFGVVVSCLFLFDYGYMNLTFSIMFVLLIVWAIQRRKEGFAPSGTLDWVTNDKRWFSEVVLKEKPIAIQDKDVATYPVQGT